MKMTFLGICQQKFLENRINIHNLRSNNTYHNCQLLIVEKSKKVCLKNSVGPGILI